MVICCGFVLHYIGLFTMYNAAWAGPFAIILALLF